MNIRHEISKKRQRDSDGPHCICCHLEDGEIENFFGRTELSFGKEGSVASFDSALFSSDTGSKRPVRKASQKENEHEDAEDSQRVKEVQVFGQNP